MKISKVQILLIRLYAQFNTASFPTNATRTQMSMKKSPWSWVQAGCWLLVLGIISLLDICKKNEAKLQLVRSSDQGMWNVGYTGLHQADWIVMMGKIEHLIFEVNFDSKLYKGRDKINGSVPQGFPFCHQCPEEIEHWYNIFICISYFRVVNCPILSFITVIPPPHLRIQSRVTHCI